jgi:hypothetical protein
MDGNGHINGCPEIIDSPLAVNIVESNAPIAGLQLTVMFSSLNARDFEPEASPVIAVSAGQQICYSESPTVPSPLVQANPDYS